MLDNLGEWIGEKLGINKAVKSATPQVIEAVNTVAQNSLQLNSDTQVLNKQLKDIIDRINSANEAAAAKQAEEERAAAIEAGKVKNELIAQAKEFEGKKAGIGQGLSAIAGEDARLQLGTQIKDVAQAANRRGLLYSGLKESAVGQTRDAAQADLMAKQQAINEDIQAQADAYNQLAAQGTKQNQDQVFSGMAQKQSNALNSYQQGLQNRRAKLMSNQNTRSFIGAQQKENDRYSDFQSGNYNPYDGFDPQAASSIGNLIGTAGTAMYNKAKAKT